MLNIRRREFITLVGGVGAAWSLAADAQQPGRIWRIGVLSLGQDESATKPLLEGLQQLGYVEGKTVAILYRFADGKVERLSELAADLVHLNPDVIYAVGGEVAPVAKNATRTIPIVVFVSNDPVQSGLVASLGRPGGNVTGITYVSDQLAGKKVELLKHAVPRVSRVAILWNPNHADPEFRETQRAARLLGVKLQSVEVRGPGDFDGAFQAMTRERAEAIIVASARLMGLQQDRIGDFAAKNRVLLVGGLKYWMDVGALLTYGPNTTELIRLNATYMDKIFKGAKPADLPMQQPAKFDLVINLKTAKRFGLTLPNTLLALADEVIE
jgi:putative ABC transport system substrate-binding protein